MILHKGKEIYPLEISRIVSKTGSVIYDRQARQKSYIYIAIENTQNKGENE